MFKFILSSGLFVLLTASPAHAHQFKLQSLEIKHPWSRATVSSASNGAVFMKIVNSGKDADALLGASSPGLAEKIELQMHADEAGVTRAHLVPRIDIPAHGNVTLKPGSFHIVLIGLKKPLVKDGLLPLNLHFQKSGEIRVEVKIEDADAMSGKMNNHH